MKDKKLNANAALCSFCGIRPEVKGRQVVCRSCGDVAARKTLTEAIDVWNASQKERRTALIQLGEA